MISQRGHHRNRKLLITGGLRTLQRRPPEQAGIIYWLTPDSIQEDIDLTIHVLQSYLTPQRCESFELASSLDSSPASNDLLFVGMG